jgi:two-component sensor histidine kinase/ActR/RegA family two-component response regulator
MMATAPNAIKPTVLIVEDEMLLRMRTVDIVEDAGFTPLEAVNADDALALLESRSDIELLFTDIQMPGTMNGLKLAHAVHERWPLIKIILVSGQVTPNEEDRPANSRFFGKPVEVQQMIAQLQDMIGQGSLKIIPSEISAGTNGAPRETTAPAAPDAAQQTLTAENGTLRLLLEQAGIDAKALLAQAGIDARERETADKLQKLILEEMHHRIKNTLATVRAITSQSLRTAISIEHGQQAIDSRLAALGHAHDLLMKARWASASFVQIIRSATEPYESQSAGKFAIQGPDIKIASAAVIAFAMTLNELCTNTTKFGALSVPSGRVDIAWHINEETQRLIFTWIESGGPVVYAPIRRSFGTRLIGSLGQQLKGEVQLTYSPAGFAYALDVPMSSLTPSE